MEAGLFLKLGGAAVAVAEAAIVLRDYVSEFDLETIRAETICCSDEYDDLMSTLEVYEEVVNEIPGF